MIFGDYGDGDLSSLITCSYHQPIRNVNDLALMALHNMDPRRDDRLERQTDRQWRQRDVEQEREEEMMKKMDHASFVEQ
ncbi:hypothetical protein F2Q70_00011113 [Brassica cretica]|uniref:Uncharacterized protein n=1 Tax=Brassica cretica TaxID=69181 RepID=A0A3N6Q3Y7_BRACR|nr:hypothetical protein F2Q70_00011113 [Brassica cretica]KAF3611254.1 hypothetical protein DY000_02044513 [Brassica cretica]